MASIAPRVLTAPQRSASVAAAGLLGRLKRMKFSIRDGAAAAALVTVVFAASAAFAGMIETGPPRDAPKAKTAPKAPPAAAAAPPAPAQPAAAPAPQSATPAAAPPSPGLPPTAKISTKGLPPPPAPANCKNIGTFEGWLASFRKEAAAEGISQRTISSALDGMTLDPSVIARDRKQGFFAQSFLDFSAKLATPNRVQSGRAQIAKNKAAFDRVEKQFGVPAPVITGFWALESDFGAGMGKLPIMRSLATLAYDCRRGPTMFRDELKAALQIIDRGDMTPETMIGSWAGEIGQTQFLPTRYLEHAIDYDGDGQPNLFSNATDIIGTTANYMVHLGWRRGEPWLEEVRVPAKLPWEEADLTIKHPRSQVGRLGRDTADGARAAVGRAARLAGAADGPLRPGVPRLSELRRLPAVEPVAELRRRRPPTSPPASTGRRP